MELVCSTPRASRSVERIDLPEYTDEVWHGYLPDLGPWTVYGYRVHGPYEPEVGHRFNPHKLLLDPYAKAHVGVLEWAPDVFGYTIGTEGDDLTFDERDSAAFMPECRVVDPAFTWTRDCRPAIPWDRTIVYEAHVRGLTMRHPLIPKESRGTSQRPFRRRQLHPAAFVGGTRWFCLIDTNDPDREDVRAFQTGDALPRSRRRRVRRPAPPARHSPLASTGCQSRPCSHRSPNRRLLEGAVS